MSCEDDYSAWWDSLPSRLQTAALAVGDVLPPWMARDLDSYDIAIVGAKFPGPPPHRVHLMTTVFREFLARHRPDHVEAL